MDTSLADPLVGRMLDGRYLVEALIARGGMATVYLGTDTRLERRVALKVMHAELARDEEFIRRFIGEAKSVARLSHPNVAAVFDQGSDGQYLYLAMEYVPGRTLRDLLAQRGWFEPPEALGMMVPLLSGLAAAHRAGIVHRDVKPENVLVGPDDRLKVVDFGLARALAGGSQTRSGVIMGTVAYLSPEQVAGTGVDARTDVYAAGIVLFELLTGVQPYTGDSPLSVAYKHVNEEVPAPSTVAVGVPPAVDRLVVMATNRDPQWRPDDAEALLHAVEEARQAAPDGMTPPAGTVLAGAAALAGGGTPQGDYGAPDGLTQGLARSGGRTVIAPRETADGYSGPPGEYGGTVQRGPRWHRWIGFGGLALLIVAVAGAATWWLTEGRYVTIPGVGGMTAAAASTVLRDDGFTVRTGTPVTNNHVRKGDVIRTAPSSGGHAVKGTAITLVTSAGPRMIQVPSVAGQSVPMAKAVLRHAGLIPAGKLHKVASPSVGAGLVISTLPAAGKPWPQPRPVILTVSEGPPLPDFVGQNAAAIQGWAQQNGISLNGVRVTNSPQPSGTITRQSPKPGTPLSRGETLTIGVSTGPPQQNVPNVDGMKIQAARATLQQLGFKVKIRRLGPFNTVFGYTPNGQQAKGTTITLFAGV